MAFERKSGRKRRSTIHEDFIYENEFSQLLFGQKKRRNSTYRGPSSELEFIDTPNIRLDESTADVKNECNFEDPNFEHAFRIDRPTDIALNATKRPRSITFNLPVNEDSIATSSASSEKTIQARNANDGSQQINLHIEGPWRMPGPEEANNVRTRLAHPKVRPGMSSGRKARLNSISQNPGDVQQEAQLPETEQPPASNQIHSPEQLAEPEQPSLVSNQIPPVENNSSNPVNRQEIDEMINSQQRILRNTDELKLLVERVLDVCHNLTVEISLLQNLIPDESRSRNCCNVT